MKDILYGIASLFMGIGFACMPVAIYKFLKNKTEMKKLEEQRRIKELEVESQNNQLRLLEEESRKYDRLIRGAEHPRL